MSRTTDLRHFKDARANAGRDVESLKDQEKDFLLTRTPVTFVQLVALLLGGLNLAGTGVVVWIFYISPSVGSSNLLDIVLLLFGSVVCIFFVYLGYLNIRRTFVGKRSAK